MRAKGVDGIVVALCADFVRRQAAIEERGLRRRVDMEYRYLNFKIYEAVRRVCRDDAETEILIDEIGGEVGYAKSRISRLSESAYKTLKRRAVDSVEEELYLK